MRFGWSQFCWVCNTTATNYCASSYALLDIQRLREQEGHDLRAAVASKTDEPRWARICLDHLVISSSISDPQERDGNDGHDDNGGNNKTKASRMRNANQQSTLRLADCIEDRLIEIYYGSKVEHIRNLHKKTGVPFADMCFFDNEHWNIKDVSRHLPEVQCFYTPNGMTRQAWDDAKQKFGLC